MAFESKSTLGLSEERAVVAASQSPATGGVRTDGPRYEPYRWTDYADTTKGTDQTTAFESLISDAASAGQPIDLGKGNTITISPSSTIDLSGIPAIVGDDVTLDLQGAHEWPSGPVFQVEGSRTQIASGVSPDAGDRQMTVNTGQSISRGDTVIIASDEAHPIGANSANGRDYYKGERLTVEKYDSGTGTLTVAPHIHFGYDPSSSNNRAYVLDEQELTIGKGITFQGDPTKDQRGLLLDQADAEIGARFENVTERCIAAVRSRLHYTGTIDSVSPTTSPATRYGVHVAGFSEVHVDSAEIWAGRHAVTQASGGFSTLDLARGDGSTDPAGYSSRYTVSGGTYGTLATNSGHRLSAIDCHGTTIEATITGANVYGGISVAADYQTVTGCYIEAHNFRGFYVTGDVASPDKDWCSLSFSDNTVRIVGSSNNKPEAPFFETLRDPDRDGDEGMRSLKISDSTFIGDFFDTDTKPFILRLPVRDPIKVEGNTFDVSYTGESFPGQTQALIEAWSDVDFTGNRLKTLEVEIEAWSTGLTVDVSGTKARDGFRRALRLDGVHSNPDDGSDVANAFEKVIAENLDITDAFRQGLSIRNATDVFVSGIVRDSGTDTNGTDAQRSNVSIQDVEQAVLRDGDFQSDDSGTNQAISVLQTGNSWAPTSTDLRLANIDVRTAVGGTEIDTSSATITLVTQRDVRTSVAAGRRDRIEHLTMPDAGSNPSNTGDVQRNGNDFVFEGGVKSIGSEAEVRSKRNVVAEGRLEADTNADAIYRFNGGTNTWDIKLNDSLNRLVAEGPSGLAVEFHDGGGFEAQGGVGMFDAGTPSQTSLSGTNSSTVDTTYDSEERDVIQNTRQRVDEIETALKDMGLLT